jgi:hypothetical protein
MEILFLLALRDRLKKIATYSPTLCGLVLRMEKQGHAQDKWLKKTVLNFDKTNAILFEF